MLKTTQRIVAALFVLTFVGSASALDVKLDPKRDLLRVLHEGKLVTIQRIQNLDNVITGDFAKTSRTCPHFCIHPMKTMPGVDTYGEIELFDFMEGPHIRGEGLIIDARVPSFHKKGVIPGSINIPFTTFEKPDSPEVAQALILMGAKRREDVSGAIRAIERMGFLNGEAKTDAWDFSKAKELVLWCNGPWCDQSPRAIKALVELGYPARKIHYYRGGMQMWLLFGLTTIVPGG